MNLGLTFLTFALLPTTLAAQTAPPLIITASRLAEPVPPQSLGADQLAVHDSLADALTRLPDLHIVQPGGRSGFAALSLRGGDPNFTLVLLDGIPLNNATSSRGGAVNLAELSPAGIERVELATGPRSAVFGSGALAGVVNLILAGGTPRPQLTATAGVGTRDDYTGSLAFRGPLTDTFGAALTAEYANDGEASPGAAFEALTLTAKLAPLGNPRTDRLLLRYNRIRSRQFPDASGGPTFATLRQTDRRAAEEWLAGLSHRATLSNTLNLDLAASLLDRTDDTTTPGVAPSALDPNGLPEGEDRTRYRRLIGQFSLRHTGDALSFATGGEVQHERGRSTGQLIFFGFPIPTSFARDRTTLAAFAEASAAQNGWQINLGARVDAISNLKTRLTARAGLAHTIESAHLTLAASHGTSFKAPSFYALGNPFVGNPALRPERASTSEATLAWAPPSGTRLTLTGFTTRYTDLIDFVFDPAPLLINRARVRSRGVTLSLAQPIGTTLDVAAAITHADTLDTLANTRLRSRPAWRANASLSWRPNPAITLGARLNHVSTQLDQSVPTGPVTLTPYQVVALDAEWRPAPGLSLRAILDNALDERFSDAIGVPSPGTRARLLVSQRF